MQVSSAMATRPIAASSAVSELQADPEMDDVIDPKMFRGVFNAMLVVVPIWALVGYMIWR